MRIFLDQSYVVDSTMPRGVIDYEETAGFDLFVMHPETRQALFDAEVHGAVLAQLVDEPYGRHPLPAFAVEALTHTSDTYLTLAQLDPVDGPVDPSLGCTQPGCWQDVTSTHRGFGLCEIHEDQMLEIDALVG